MAKRETVWIANLYLRLSKEDKRSANAESISIETQRMKTSNFANNNNIIIRKEYVDDGESGVFFERPEFQAMMHDVEEGNANCIIVKDLSRLGRNDVQANLYYEDIFIARGIRFIAIDDGVDTYLNGYQQIATFKNMYNAMYPRDISEKTRSAYKTKSESGWFLGSKAPYGYKKNPKDKHHLIIDEEVAHIVKHIFDLAKQGYGKRKITKILHEEKIPTPAAYAKAQGMNHYSAMTAHDDEYYWCDDTVGDMLINEVYIGNMVNHKKEKPFKSKKFRDVPKDEWIVVENTHEPIIDKQTFDEVQKLLESRSRETKTGETQIFAKIIKCMDCKKALVFSNATKSYVCNTYNLKGKQYCPSHYIRYDELYGVVLADIYAKTVILETDREALYKAALKCNEQKIMAETKDNQRKLAKANKRIDELELLIKKTYENSVLGNLSSERMASLLAEYEKEQAELKVEASRIESELKEYHKSKDNAIDFVNLIEKYIGIKELNYEILHELIDRIEVGEKYEYQGETYQDINIYYKFVGTVEILDDLCYTKDAG